MRILLQLILLISLVIPTISIQAAPIITNTANATYTINGAALSLSDSVQFTKDTIVTPPDLITLQKQANSASAAIGNNITYTLRVNNPNSKPLSNVTIQDILPTGLIYQAGTAKLNNLDINTTQITHSGSNLELNLGNIPANTTWSVTYKVKATTATPLGNAINRATVISDTATSTQSRATVLITAKVRTPSTINFLKFNDNGVISVIQPTAFNTDQNGGENFEDINNIPLPDGSVIDLPTSQRILTAAEYTESDPVIIEVIDLDQNLDPTKLETITVTIEIPGTNDKEVLLLTETTPDSGIFRGVVLTTTDTTNIQNGLLTITDGARINVTYRDNEDSTDSIVSAALVVPDISLQITKNVDKSTSSIGELVRYTLEFRNTTGFNLPNLKVHDLLPTGFRYIANTALLNGNPLNNNVTTNGRSLDFDLNSMPTGTLWRIEYVTKISAGVKIGDAINTAFLTSGTLRSNTARVTVDVKDELMRTKNILTGRVYTGCKATYRGKHKITPEVLKEARIYMETGRSVLTDAEGFWHMEGVQPGAHVLQLDTESIPGYEPLLCQDNTRHAGDAKSQFVDLEAGSLWHVNFHVKPIEGYLNTSDKEPEKVVNIDPVKLFGDEYIESTDEGFEILWPRNNYVPAVASTKIIVKSSPQHRVEAYLNGKEVNPLNYDGSDTNKARTVTIRRWLGVDINIKDRNNQLLVILKDQTGKEIARKTHHIHFSGNPASAQLLTAESTLVADGKTTPVIALRIKDEEGFPMRANTHGYFTLEDNRYTVKTQNNNKNSLNLNEDLGGTYKYLIKEGGIARIELNPTTQSGEIKLNLKFDKSTNNRATKISAWLKPALREWILVGIAEGTLAHKRFSGNIQPLEDLGKSDKFYKRGRIAFFAKGQIKGKYLLTAAYDTHKANYKVGKQLGGNINPDAFYTIYADNSNSQYDAPSSRKLYLKIEKDNFYALFGDFHSGMTVTDLANYQRILNGIKTEYQGKRFSYKAYISETSNNHQHDEIPGDGTSGLYKLTANIIPNSESIKIETRDRFHSDRILETRQLTRYQDYNIDYDSGTLFFKFPVTGRDSSFNPNIIVVDYDSEKNSNKTIVAGGRVAMKSFNDKLETGLSVIHEGRSKAKDDRLIATDLTYNITPDTRIHAEVAQSKTEKGNFKSTSAYIIELEKEIKQMEMRLFLRKQGENYGISSQASESAIKKAGAELNYQINDKTRMNSEISYANNLSNNNKRKLVAVGIQHRHKNTELNAGLRHTQETIRDDNSETNKINSNTVLLGGKYTTNNGKVALRTNIEKNFSSDNGSEISPDRLVVGIDVKLKNGFSVFAENEATDNGKIITHNNRIGINKDLWKGAKGKTTYTQERTDQGQRNYATLGLSQKLKVSDKISADFSIDQAKTLSGNQIQNRFNENEPELQGTQRDDYTAFSVGLGSNDKDWSWTTRAEWRKGEIQDKINFLAGVVRHYDNGKNLSAKLSYYNSDNSNGGFDKNLKLSLGSAFHPKEKDFVFFSRLDLVLEDLNTTNTTNNNAFESDTQKIIHNMHYNRKINEKTQFSIHHGVKYIKDENDGVKSSTTVDTATIKLRRDINKHWNIGLHGGYLHDWNNNVVESVAGASIGVNPAKNTWIELGYNFEGFDDDDFDSSNYTRKGPYLDFRYKINQDIFRQKSTLPQSQSNTNQKIKVPLPPLVCFPDMYDTCF